MNPSIPSSSKSSRQARRIGPWPLRWWAIAVVAVLILGVGGFIGTYLYLFNGSSAAPLTLSSGPTAAAQFNASAVSGTWSIAPGSLVGYRVREKLAMLPAKSDAVGRTSNVAGTITLLPSGAGVMVTAANFIADVRTLKSDRSMRDQRIHSIGLQSDQYPTASFKLTQPISLPASALKGKVVHASAVGKLTIHGTTHTVTIPISGRLRSKQIEAAGSITFLFSQFGMQAPSIAGFVSVEDHATMEFDLRFQRGGASSTAARIRTLAAIKPVKSSGFGGPGGPLPGNGHGSGPNSKQFQAFQTCLSNHGVKFTPGGPPPGSGQQNPKMAAAMQACSRLLPQGGPPPGGPGAGPAPASTPAG